MKRGLVTIGILVLLIALLTGIVIVSAATDQNFFVLAGKLFQKTNSDSLKPNSNDTIVAKYKETEIMASIVSYHKEMDRLKNPDAVRSDLEIINSILETVILLEEAERLGLSATDDEIESMVQNTLIVYESPDGKDMMDAYLAGAGMTLDEYLETLREQAPRIISRQKLLDHIGRQYCEEHDIEFTKLNPPAEMVAAQDAYIESLIEQNKAYIEYYIDIPEVS